jgi:hypothetical protein
MSLTYASPGARRLRALSAAHNAKYEVCATCNTRHSGAAWSAEGWHDASGERDGVETAETPAAASDWRTARLDWRSATYSHHLSNDPSATLAAVSGDPDVSGDERAMVAADAYAASHRLALRGERIA